MLRLRCDRGWCVRGHACSTNAVPDPYDLGAEERGLRAIDGVASGAEEVSSTLSSPSLAVVSVP